MDASITFIHALGELLANHNLFLVSMKTNDTKSIFQQNILQHIKTDMPVQSNELYNSVGASYNTDNECMNYILYFKFQAKRYKII